MIVDGLTNGLTSTPAALSSHLWPNLENRPEPVFHRIVNGALRAMDPVAREAAATVYVVDDDNAIREQLAELIGCAGWHVKTFSSAQAFLERSGPTDTGCVILDVSLADQSGLELQQRLTRDRRNIAIIFMTAHGDVATTVRAMKAGAIEFLTKPIVEGVMLAAVGDAVKRSRNASDELATLNRLLANFDLLSNRERQVMALIVTGYLNKQAAGHLGISEITVKAHRGQVMRKMRARSFAELVMMGAKLGLTSAAACEIKPNRVTQVA